MSQDDSKPVGRLTNVRNDDFVDDTRLTKGNLETNSSELTQIEREHQINGEKDDLAALESREADDSGTWVRIDTG